MSKLTLRVVQGADRGRVFADLNPPISIGREEGNTIQLNDERISRFHCKILADNQHLVLTDLESTNGTKVNGQVVQLRLLRYGDLIVIGRSVLLFGTSEQIRSRVNETYLLPDSNRPEPTGSEADFELDPDLLDPAEKTGEIQRIPSLPDRLSPSQAAQLAELLEYLHSGMGEVVDAVQVTDKKGTISVDISKWQALLLVYGNLAELIRGISDPDFRLPG
jgi:pSer/pThr/pTyr-binding forkhead associated (FHA) protein